MSFVNGERIDDFAEANEGYSGIAHDFEKLKKSHEALLKAAKEATEFVAFAAARLKYQTAGKEFDPNRESAEGTLARLNIAIAQAEGKS